MRKPLMKPEEKRHVNLQTLVTLREQRKLLQMVKETRRSISNILRDGLRYQFEQWDKNGRSEQ